MDHTDYEVSTQKSDGGGSKTGARNCREIGQQAEIANVTEYGRR
jgi:hypothetical protein